MDGVWLFARISERRSSDFLRGVCRGDSRISYVTVSVMVVSPCVLTGAHAKQLLLQPAEDTAILRPMLMQRASATVSKSNGKFG